MVFHKLVLFPRSDGSFRGTFGIFAIHIDVAPFNAKLPVVNILLEFWQGFCIPAGTEWTLVVGEFHQYNGSINIAYRYWIILIAAYHLISNVLGCCLVLLSILLGSVCTS